MEFLEETYYQNPGLWNVVMGLLIFGGLGRIAFWRKDEGLSVGAPLAIGLGLLLTIAVVVWGHEQHRTIQEFGPWAARLVTLAIVLLAVRAWSKSKES